MATSGSRSIGFGTSFTRLASSQLLLATNLHLVLPVKALVCGLSVQRCMEYMRSHTEGMLHQQLADLQCGRNLCALKGRLLRLRLVLTRAGAVSKIQCLTEYES